MKTAALNVFQQLIDEACKTKGNMSYDQFVSNLYEPHQAAILFKDLNYQVTNGGFYQWINEGFGTDKHIEMLIDYLPDIRTETAGEMLQILQELKAIKADIHPELDHEEDHYAYDALDSYYGQINTRLLADLNEWLAIVVDE